MLLRSRFILSFCILRLSIKSKTLKKVRGIYFVVMWRSSSAKRKKYLVLSVLI